MIAIYRQRVGGCSPVGKIAQQEYGISRCEISPARFTLANQSSCKITMVPAWFPQRIFQANAPVTCACLHPNQQEMVVGDQSGAIHIWNLQVWRIFLFIFCYPNSSCESLYRIMLQNDQSEPIIPDPKASIQHVAIDPKGHHMAAVNNKVSKTSAKICV